MSEKEGQVKSKHVPGSVRHAEKRRTGTCRFADRIAQLSLDTYRSSVPQSFQEQQKQTCVATIVAHFGTDGHLQVMGLGAGTKFLTEKVLRAEESSGVGGAVGEEEERRGYGFRVRDCHAEVLARRAFRRQLTLEMKILAQDGSIELPPTYRPILQKTANDDSFELVDGVTLHFYASSAPCGNAVVKKFAKMEKETFNADLGPDEWPDASHEPVEAHSLRLGQFALLVKKDSSAVATKTEAPAEKPDKGTKGKVWPANQSDDWCPPGTSIVSFQKGSIHTCSDKLCRWNCLGLQGSLLASLLKNPLYMSSITVGRKLSGCICRRAVCCRADGFGKPDASRKRKRGPKEDERVNRAPETNVYSVIPKYSLHHPAVMGTGVYMDDTGTIDMTDAHKRNQDTLFASSLAWVWWPLIGVDSRKGASEEGKSGTAECIDGSTGMVYDYFGDTSDASNGSMISTKELLRLFSQVKGAEDAVERETTTNTLKHLRGFKRQTSPEYEAVKDELLSKHRVFRQWRRRECERGDNGCITKGLETDARPCLDDVHA